MRGVVAMIGIAVFFCSLWFGATFLTEGVELDSSTQIFWGAVLISPAVLLTICVFLISFFQIASEVHMGLFDRTPTFRGFRPPEW
ncbi:MAG: hypothetical protein A2806_01320 [Candidatus Terrybacteria bacterium RIFCSPHIGHO2_01_FULL_48_17]|uniref:Uncharacterized protein n=1 Tax=Candidatus Terrybacteria bacterium RIFCSPHIGHO2_01_FULL_48_17 TaxID=1802362 RepID=A0A1G2PJB9_9BACT|nr:MAG: hypothetical protein A2806_01320 [Candidatus Terrybacteria bacterium RIFCSPHIGHO2_01_FULL_48_17]OHA52244.1 MAG: hypothetical protein A3A30_04575 [Candidatus Terrybacteria bacterium RIFCSPLOWO2_01_FULL_48_14]